MTDEQALRLVPPIALKLYHLLREDYHQPPDLAMENCLRVTRMMVSSVLGGAPDEAVLPSMTEEGGDGTGGELSLA